MARLKLPVVLEKKRELLEIAIIPLAVAIKNIHPEFAWNPLIAIVEEIEEPIMTINATLMQLESQIRMDPMGNSSKVAGKRNFLLNVIRYQVRNTLIIPIPTYPEHIWSTTTPKFDVCNIPLPGSVLTSV